MKTTSHIHRKNLIADRIGKKRITPQYILSNLMLVIVCLVASSCATTWFKSQVSPKEERAEGVANCLLILCQNSEFQAGRLNAHELAVFEATYKHVHTRLNDGNLDQRVTTPEILVALKKLEVSEDSDAFAARKFLIDLMEKDPQGWFGHFRKVREALSPGTKLIMEFPEIGTPPSSESTSAKSQTPVPPTAKETPLKKKEEGKKEEGGPSSPSKNSRGEISRIALVLGNKGYKVTF